MLCKSAWTPANLARSISCRASSTRIYVSSPATSAANGLTLSVRIMCSIDGITPSGCGGITALTLVLVGHACLMDAACALHWDLGTGGACDLATGAACDLATGAACDLATGDACDLATTGLTLATGAKSLLDVPALEALWLQALRTARAEPMASVADAGTIGGAAGNVFHVRETGGCVGGAAGGACWPSGKRCVWWHRCWFSGSTGGASGRLGLLDRVDLEDESLPARLRTACAVGSNNSARNNSHDAIFISKQFLEPKLIWHIYMGLVGGVGGWVGGWDGRHALPTFASPGPHWRAF